MRFSKHLYFGEHAREHKDYILKNIRDTRLQFLAYVVIEGKGSNLYEFFPSYMLMDTRLYGEDTEILGIGYGYRDTLMLVKSMVEERFLHDSIDGA